MDENQNNVSATTSSDPTKENYIEALNQLKQNTVDRAKYDQVVAENKQLVQTLVNGGTLEQEAVSNKRSAQEIRDELFDGKDRSNLDFCKLSLELREAVMNEEGQDIFVAASHELAPTSEDYVKAQNVADVLQSAIDYAQGDSEAFTNEVMRRTNDIRLPR